MISGGVQSAWKNLNESPTFELLFNIDLYRNDYRKEEVDLSLDVHERY